MTEIIMNKNAFNEMVIIMGALTTTVAEVVKYLKNIPLEPSILTGLSEVLRSHGIGKLDPDFQTMFFKNIHLEDLIKTMSAPPKTNPQDIPNE